MFIYTIINWLQEQQSATNYVWARVLTTPHSHSAGFDAGMGSWDNSWTAVKELWWSAAMLCGWEHTPVSSATQKQPCSTGISRPDPVACDTLVQRRLSAEPKTPFLHQMYFLDLVVQQLQSPTWLFLIVWLFNAAVFFFYFLGGKDIIIQPHLFNCSNWSHSNWALPFICNGNDYEIVFVLSSLVWWVRVEWYDCFSRFHPVFGGLFIFFCIFCLLRGKLCWRSSDLIQHVFLYFHRNPASPTCTHTLFLILMFVADLIFGMVVLNK